jgi:hypothetical protein
MERKYISILDKRQVSAQQYLVELVLDRKARKNKKVLPDKFWNEPLYKNDYKVQIIAASNLLKYFKFEDILFALNSKDGNWIFSLGYKGLIDIIKKHRVINKIEEVKAVSSVESIKNVDEKNIYRKPSVTPKKSTINRLRELDG